VTVSVTGKISLRRPRNSWNQPFEGWANCYGANGEILAQPAVDPDGNIYLATRRAVHSWDSGGKLRWRKPLNCTTLVSWSSGKLYVADDSPALLQLDPVSGTLEERLPLKAGAACNPSLWENSLALVLVLGEVQLFQLPLSQ
jgi:outer membrane protein assembly factor BamB